MIRKIIKIDEEKCNGCGMCASACHEGAIGMKRYAYILTRLHTLNAPCTPLAIRGVCIETALYHL